MKQCPHCCQAASSETGTKPRGTDRTSSLRSFIVSDNTQQYSLWVAQIKQIASRLIAFREDNREPYSTVRPRTRLSRRTRMSVDTQSSWRDVSAIASRAREVPTWRRRGERSRHAQDTGIAATMGKRADETSAVPYSVALVGRVDRLSQGLRSGCLHL